MLSCHEFFMKFPPHSQETACLCPAYSSKVDTHDGQTPIGEGGTAIVQAGCPAAPERERGDGGEAGQDPAMRRAIWARASSTWSIRIRHRSPDLSRDRAMSMAR